MARRFGPCLKATREANRFIRDMPVLASISAVMSQSHDRQLRVKHCPFRLTISGIREVCGAFSSTDLVETRSDGLTEAPDGECGIPEGVCGDLAKDGLEFGK